MAKCREVMTKDPASCNASETVTKETEKSEPVILVWSPRARKPWTVWLPAGTLPK